jgi:hypothetical protein
MKFYGEMLSFQQSSIASDTQDQTPLNPIIKDDLKGSQSLIDGDPDYLNGAN